MAYVMTLKLGDDFYINGARFEVAKISSSDAFTILRSDDGKSFDMVDGEMYQIAPLTSAFVGTKGTVNQAQINVSAPKSVLIDPGDSYRQAGGHTKRSALN